MIRTGRLGASTAGLGGVAGGAAWVLGAYIAAIGLRAVLQLLLARWLGAEALGAYVSAVTLGGLLGTVATGGIGAAALRFVPLYRGTEDARRLGAFEAFAGRAPLLIGVPLGLATGLVMWVLGPRWLPEAPPLLAVLVPMVAVLTVQSELARAFGRMALAYLPQQALPAAGTLLACAALEATGRLDASTALGAYAASLLVAVLARRRRLEAATPAGNELEAGTPRREWLRVSMPLLAASVLAMVLAQGDVLLVAASLGGESTGVYAAAVRVAYLAGLPLLAVSAAAVPALASDVARGDLTSMEARFRRSARLAAALTLLATVVGWVAGPWVLGVVGADFEAGATALRIVLLGQLAQSMLGPVEQLLGATGYHDAAVAAGTASVLAFVAMTAGFALAWGIEGAAVGAALGQLLWRGALAALMSKRLGVRAGAW
ncbi:MAG: lipopolysaccharide biosynthesis protein [Dehalococcoidia bacterium]